MPSRPRPAAARLKRAALPAAATAALLTLTAACSGGTPAPASSSGTATVRIGVYPGNLTTARIAQRQGYFAQHHLAVTFVTLTAGPAIVAAAESGSIDVGYGDTLAVAGAAGNGFGDVRVIQPGNVQTTRHSSDEDLLAAPGSGVHDAGDLAGKTIGLIPYPEINVASRLMLREHGVDPDSAKFITITDGTQAALLRTRGADAVEGRNVGEDQKLTGASHAVDLGSPLDVIPPHTITTSYFANTGWLKADPDVANRLVGALREAAHYYNSASPQQLAALNTTYGGVDYPSLEKTYPGILDKTHWNTWTDGPATPADVTATQKWVRTAVTYGQLKKAVPVGPLLYRTATAATAP